MKNPLLYFLLAAVAGFALAGCTTDDGPMSVSADPNSGADESAFPVSEEFAGQETLFKGSEAPSGDIVDTAVGAGISTLVAAVQAAGLEDALRSEGPFTVFAPTNEAFEKLPAGLLDALLLEENVAKLQQILTYHVLDSKVRSRDLRLFQRVETLEGSDLNIFRFFRLVVVNHNPVIAADVRATNGIIHVIDEVLIPEGFTLEDAPEPMADLVDTAVGAGLSTLVAAVQAAGLEDALRGEDALTVFAPSNAAFEDLPAGTVDFLLQEENKGLLTELLLYHVTAGKVLSTDLRFFQRVPMLSGDRTWIFRSGDYVRVNFSRVIAANVEATNGVAHVIDRVLIPPSFYGQVAGLPNEAPEMDMRVPDMVDSSK